MPILPIWVRRGASCVAMLVACGSAATAQPLELRVTEVQGAAARSPHEGSRVSVEGRVGHVSLGDCGLGGFFLEGDPGASPSGASRGLFVHAPDAPVGTGQRLRVEGTVREYRGRTELTDSVVHGVVMAAAPIAPSPLAGLDAETLERFEGMRVRFETPLRVLDNHALASRGRLIVGLGERAVSSTQLAYPAASAVIPSLVLDDGCEQRDPRPVPHGAGPGRPLRAGARLVRLEGVVDEDLDGHRLHALSFEVLDDNPRPEAPPAVAGSLRVVGFNVGRFLGLDGGEATAAQHAKLTATLSALDADILALSEVGSGGGSGALDELVDALSAAGSRTYGGVQHAREGGAVGIAVALVHDTRSVEALSDVRVLDTAVDARFDDRRNRRAIARHYGSIRGDEQLLVAVAHLKSKSGSCAAVGDVDRGDGQGACPETRLSAARALGDFVADHASTLAVPALLMGDLNSYAAEPPLQALRSTGLVDLIGRHLGQRAYTYVYRGAAGYLDHALGDATLAAHVRGVGIWHINADESPLFGPGPSGAEPSAYRSSDHDPVIVGLFDAPTGSELFPASSPGTAGAAEAVPPTPAAPSAAAPGCLCAVGAGGCGGELPLAVLVCVVALLVRLRRARRRSACAAREDMR